VNDDRAFGKAVESQPDSGKIAESIRIAKTAAYVSAHAAEIACHPARRKTKAKQNHSPSSARSMARNGCRPVPANTRRDNRIRAFLRIGDSVRFGIHPRCPKDGNAPPLRSRKECAQPSVVIDAINRAEGEELLQSICRIGRAQPALTMRPPVQRAGKSAQQRRSANSVAGGFSKSSTRVNGLFAARRTARQESAAWHRA